MSNDESPVYINPEDDPKMEQAFKLAQQSFRFFWREASWESRRIVPGLDIAIVKAAFSDPPGQGGGDAVEQMWIGDVNFDGKVIMGTLNNQPNWLTSVKEGDRVTIEPKRLSDWMYAIGGVVYGGFSVGVIRSKMKKAERTQHDQAWGMEFADPKVARMVPPEYIGKKKGMFGGAKSQTVAEVAAREHPMALNMRASLEEMLQSDPNNVSVVDEQGFTLLHTLSLAGSASLIEILLRNGADPNLPAKNGMTPLLLAKSLGWKKATATLEANGAT